jgi:hypothetical protein
LSATNDLSGCSKIRWQWIYSITSSERASSIGGIVRPSEDGAPIGAVRHGSARALIAFRVNRPQAEDGEAKASSAVARVWRQHGHHRAQGARGSHPVSDVKRSPTARKTCWQWCRPSPRRRRGPAAPRPTSPGRTQISLTTLLYLGLDEAAQLSAEFDAFLPAKFPERDETTVDGEILPSDERCGIARQMLPEQYHW